MNNAFALNQLKQIATEIQGIDAECYSLHKQELTTPILGLGKADARWCFFGRDPGDTEVKEQRPFFGEAGQRVRSIMREFDLTDDDIFWMNTVPFKPIRNKAWPINVRRRFQPILLKFLGTWKGTEVVTFGEAAFKWFGLSSPENRRSIEQFWKRADKYHSQFQVSLSIEGIERCFTLYPVPHPSLANATWSARFPELFTARLRSTPTTSVGDHLHR